MTAVLQEGSQPSQTATSHKKRTHTHTHTHTQEETVCSCVGDEQAEPQALTLTRCSAVCLVTGCVTISTLR